MKFVMYRDEDSVIGSDHGGEKYYFSKGLMGISTVEKEEKLIAELKIVGDGDEENDSEWNNGGFEGLERIEFEIDEGGFIIL
jgi:hypothetical protein